MYSDLQKESKRVAILGGEPIGRFAIANPWSEAKNCIGIEKRNKSDRKRDKANRWR